MTKTQFLFQIVVIVIGLPVFIGIVIYGLVTEKRGGAEA